MIRQLLAFRLGVAAQQLAFRTGAHGKPESAESGWRFNLTHTRTLVAAALAWRVEVGIDAEALDPDRIAGLDLPAMFTEAECAELGAQPMPEAVLRRWTLKEAWLKAQGIGLGFAPNELHVHLGSPPSVVPTAAFPAADWQVWSLIPEPSHVMAVAAMGRLGLDVAAYDFTGSSVIACNDGLERDQPQAIKL